MADPVRFGACEVCGAHPSDGTTTFRVNPKGKGTVGIFRCTVHAMLSANPPDEDIMRITDALTGGRASNG